MNNHFSKILLSFAAASGLCSCVNEDYDLEKVKIDEIHALDNIGLPIGETKKFMLSDLFSGFDSAQYLKTDSEGNYFVEFVGDSFTTEVEIPGFQFAGYSDKNPHTSTVDKPIQMVSLTVGDTAPIHSQANLGDIHFNIELNQTDIPEQIIDINYADVDSELIIKLSYDQSSVPFSRLWLMPGLTLTFPEWIVLGDAPEGFSKNGLNALSLTGEFAITSSNTDISVSLDALDFSKMPDGQGLLEPGKLYLNSEVILSEAVLELRSDDCTNISSGSFSPSVTAYLHMDPMTIQSVTVELDVEDVCYTEFEAALNDVSNLMGDLDATIDLTGLRLNVGIVSTLPAAINIESNIFASSSSSENDKEMALGTIHIPMGSPNAPGTAYYSISEDGTGAPADYQNMAVANWNTLLSPIPEYVKFSLAPSLDNEVSKYMTVVPDSRYELQFDYSFSCSAFGPAFRIATTKDINDMAIKLDEADIPSVKLIFNAINTIPIEMTIAAEPIDADGNVLTNITAEVDSSIKAGSLDVPTNTPVALTLRSNGPIEFDGLKLAFTATTASDYSVLNINQYLQLTDIALVLPEGLTFNVDNN